MAVNDTTSSQSAPPLPGTSTPTVQRTQDRRMNPVFRYLRESRLELMKVTWPSRDQVINLTVVVLVVCILMAAFTGGIDYVFSSVIRTFVVG